MAAWRKEEVDAARHRQEKREATRLGNLLSQTGVWNFAKPHLLYEPKISLYGRETDRLGPVRMLKVLSRDRNGL